ncbi:glycosyltransferase family 2 protein [Nitrincola sp. MINF-07-Sa-05]|uniref:glycosyltransferase family 2 protein n=1 Tax=Nitrincola salilacus TaxID=3400273 RepID=UPI003917BD98
MPSNCFLIPIYNHDDTITATVRTLSEYQLPVIIVDDGSDERTRQVLQQLQQDEPLVQLLTLDKNIGKGGAVMAGMRHAVEQGYTHALQVDADGQHDLADIPALWALSAANPEALISGLPLYDDSIPRSRLIGRYITHVWVWIETLSFSVKDSMCGFRVYPLANCIELIDTSRLGKRMDFDTEIMVRLYWRDISVLFLPTRVIYPQGGRSHFKLLQDNWLISKMHTRLFFGMLWRLPGLLSFKWRRAHATGS